MTANKALRSMQEWIERSWLTQLDRAFAGFLLDQDATASNLVLWAGALVSHQLERGDVFLDLGKMCTNPGFTLAIPDDNSTQTLADDFLETSDLFKSHTLADWIDALSQSILVATSAGDTPLVLQDNRLYLRRYWQYQQLLNSKIDLRLSSVRAELPDSIQKSLTQLFPIRSVQPDWQKIACVLALRARFAIITGGPGTGKTTTLIKLLSLLIELATTEQNRTLHILLAAPTGKAAARVSESISNALTVLPVPEAIKKLIPQKAATLHRLLGSRPDSRRFRHHRHNPLLADVVIVDEASMIDLEMMAGLLDALTDNTTLILLGDKDQLASVEAGSVMGDLCNGAENYAYDAKTVDWMMQYAGTNLSKAVLTGSAVNQQTVMLKRSYRFDIDSGIGQLARAVNSSDVNQAKAILYSQPPYPDLSRQLLTTPLDTRLKQLANNNDNTKPAGYGHFLQLMQQRPSNSDNLDSWALVVLKAFDRFRILCATRKGEWGVEHLNQQLEYWLFAENKPGNWYQGRPVMITRNDYNLGLMNGDIGIALLDASSKLRIAFPGDAGNIRWVSPLRLPAVETAFAMTVHKSQGSEFEHVALLLPEVRYRVLSKELVYTGITRAKRHFTLLESRPDIFEQAIQLSCR